MGLEARQHRPGLARSNFEAVSRQIREGNLAFLQEAAENAGVGVFSCAGGFSVPIVFNNNNSPDTIKPSPQVIFMHELYHMLKDNVPVGIGYLHPITFTVSSNIPSPHASVQWRPQSDARE